MKNPLKLLVALVALLITSCSNPVDADIKKYLKSNANDPNSVELVEVKLIRTQTISNMVKLLRYIES